MNSKQPDNADAGKLREIARKAREASYKLAALNTGGKNRLLRELAGLLEQKTPEICAANAVDMREAEDAGLSGAMLDRLLLTPERLAAIAGGVRHVADLEDPVGRVPDGRDLDCGLRLFRRCVPLGVVAAIYEARPNVTVDISALCLKTGNAAILRGGGETGHTNRVLAGIIRQVLLRNELPAEAVQSLTDPGRAQLEALLRLDADVDVLILRGGAAMQKFCREHSRIPVICGGIGLCHIFVDKSARQDLALPVLANAKLQRPGVCNSMETVLIHADIAAEFIPKMLAYMGSRGASFHPDAGAQAYFPADCPYPVRPLAESELEREWLTPDMNVIVTPDLDGALWHIRRHGSGHSDSILTENMETAERFIREVDSAAVYVNSSTRFTDGAEFGLGAEVAISTQKLHARGPMALEALTTYKWIAHGDYTVRK
ncbi:MAG: glutamate-5-semialdehyde dehydrogenase [Deltaproteobacteria bacterium]|nr:glutamate-5-semialdehyde dehydrogenase [Deltaproteobacteria bacterium]